MRTMLECLPAGKSDIAPHPKSRPVGKLAPHVAQLGGFGVPILTQPALDFAQSTCKPLPFESSAQLVRAFDEGTAQVTSRLRSERPPPQAGG